MEKSKFSQGILERLLMRTGGWYIIIIALFALSVASITMLLGFLVEVLNADYSAETKTLLNQQAAIVTPAAIIILCAIVFLLTGKIRANLNIWKDNPENLKKTDTAVAWYISNNITWKYAIASIIVSIAFLVVPKLILLSRSRFVTQDQIIYGFIAGLVTIIGFVPLSTILLDGFLVPVRNILFPGDFTQQLSGLGKLKILYKILAIVIASLFIIALLIAPIGYHQTTRVLNTENNFIEVITDLQIQSILVGGFAILFSVSLVYLFSRSISNPLQQLLDTFQKIESGNLSIRVPVVSSDEIGTLGIYFNRMVDRLQELQSNLEKMVEERTSQLKAINEVGRVATSTLDPEKLISRVVNLITDEFGYYHAAIFLIDQSDKWVELKDASGEAGRVLKESEYRIQIDKTNIIGRAIRSQQAQIALDVGDNAVRFDHPLLPYTRSQIALPLFVGDRILGVLDVHSSQEAAFSEQDIETLQNMANQVAISLDNARLFQETNQNLREMRNIQKQYLHEAWLDTSLPGGEITLAIGKSGAAESSQLEVPITLREQIIGQIHLERNEDFSTEDQIWLEAIATQTALALENARLYNEAQNRATREQIIGDISASISTFSDVDGILRTAVQQLGRRLGGAEVVLELGNQAEEGRSGNELV